MKYSEDTEEKQDCYKIQRIKSKPPEMNSDYTQLLKSYQQEKKENPSL